MNKLKSIGIVCLAGLLLTGCTGEVPETETERATEAYVQETVRECAETYYTGLDALYFLNAETEAVFKTEFASWLRTEGITAETIEVAAEVRMNETKKLFDCSIRVSDRGSANNVLAVYDMEAETWTFAFGNRPETEETFAEETTTSDEEIQEALEKEAKELSASYVPEPEDASLAPGTLTILNESELPVLADKDKMYREASEFLEAMHDVRREVLLVKTETGTGKMVLYFRFQTVITDEEILSIRWNEKNRTYTCAYMKGEELNEIEEN